MEVDGGGVELVSITEDVVSVKLKGTCLHCPSASLTMKLGIEQNLKRELPWITDVVRVL